MGAPAVGKEFRQDLKPLAAFICSCSGARELDRWSVADFGDQTISDSFPDRETHGPPENSGWKFSNWHRAPHEYRRRPVLVIDLPRWQRGSEMSRCFASHFEMNVTDIPAPPMSAYP